MSRRGSERWRVSRDSLPAALWTWAGIVALVDAMPKPERTKGALLSEARRWLFRRHVPILVGLEVSMVIWLALMEGPQRRRFGAEGGKQVGLARFRPCARSSGAVLLVVAWTMRRMFISVPTGLRL
jgi:hypothetical protein